MNLEPGDLFAVAGVAAVLYIAGVSWSHHRQRVAAIKRELRKEPPVSEPVPMKAAPNRNVEFSYRAENERSKPTRRQIGASAESRRQSVPGTAQTFRSSPADSDRRRREDEDRRNDDFTTLAIIAASQPDPAPRSEPQRCNPSYDDSPSRSSSSGGCSGSWGGGSDSSSSSSSSDSGSCSSGCD